jgi:exopolysaccharide biosynthesis polyprenyl glycosylphosphotransferase
VNRRGAIPLTRKRGLGAFWRSNAFVAMCTVCIDLISLTIAVVLGIWWVERWHESTVWIWAMALYVPLVILFLAVRMLYRRNLHRRFTDEIVPVETMVALASLSALSIFTFVGEPAFPGTLVSRMWLCAAVLVPTARLMHAATQRRLRRLFSWRRPTLIVGNGHVALQLFHRLKESWHYGLAPVGLVSVEEPSSFGSEADTANVPHVGSPNKIEDAIRNTGAEAVIVAFSRMNDHQLVDNVIRVAQRDGLDVWVVPRMFDAIGQRVRVEHVGGLPLLALPHADPRGWKFVVKHVTDRIVAAVGLVVLSPFLLTLALLVRISSPGPILLRQKRVGRDGLVFECLKFRSMRLAPATADAFEADPGKAPGGVEGEDRRTRIGKILRATSLDELPQLLNVVKGEMSLVGPRPERPEFVGVFDRQVRRYGERHRVKAGMTGWAQVHGLRGQTSIADRAEWDNYYIENWSMALDFKILALTIPAILRRSE